MPNPALAACRPLSRFARDTAVYSALGAIPVGRLRGGQVGVLVAASAAIGAAAAYVALRASEAERSATPDGWMPWTPYAQSAPTDPTGTVGDGSGSRRGEDRRALLRRSVLAAVAGSVSGGATALAVVADRRMESFFAIRGVRHRRLAVGLSQGVAYAALIALFPAVFDSREGAGEPAGSAPAHPSE